MAEEKGIVKYCSTCNSVKSTINFHKNKTRSDGLQDYCIECMKIYRREWRNKNFNRIRHKERNRAKQYRLNNREKINQKKKKRRKQNPKMLHAQLKVYDAITRTKKLKKPNNCSLCGLTENICAHHEDYSKPLDIIWACAKCHKQIHMEV